MPWVMYQWSLAGRREGPLGTIICFRAPHLFKKKKKGSGGEWEKWQKSIGTNCVNSGGANVAEWIKVVDCQSTMCGFNSRRLPIYIYIYISVLILSWRGLLYPKMNLEIIKEKKPR